MTYLKVEIARARKEEEDTIKSQQNSYQDFARIIRL
jgi:hypothetical protein